MIVSTKKLNKEVRINIRMTRILRKLYHSHCLKNKTTISDRVRVLIENDLKYE